MTSRPSSATSLLERPAGEPVQRGGQLLGHQLDQPVRRAAPRRPAGGCTPVGQPVARPGRALFAFPRVAGVPSATIRPPRSPRPGRRGTAPRPCSGWSAARSCRAPARFLTTSQASWRAEGSKPVVGSSRNSRSGFTGQGDRDVQPALLAARQLQHPGVALRGQADQVDHLIDRARMRVVPRVHRDRLDYGQVPVHPGRLQDDPDPALQPLPLPLPPRVVSQDLDLAAVPCR